MSKKPGYVYIMTNAHNKILYTGVTSDLKKRVWQHKEKTCKGFTGKYNVDKLVYFESMEGIRRAIQREKQIKAGSRKKKIEMISAFNKKWEDLYNGL